MAAPAVAAANAEPVYAEDLGVGDRVQAMDGFRATVRFVGSIPRASPPDGWIGVEWDAVRARCSLCLRVCSCSNDHYLCLVRAGRSW